MQCVVVIRVVEWSYHANVKMITAVQISCDLAKNVSLLVLPLLATLPQVKIRAADDDQ